MPAEMAVTPALKPTTSCAISAPSSLPVPSWPEALSPQHFAMPPPVSAQVCSYRRRWPSRRSQPDNVPGVSAVVVVPLPSWPLVPTPALRGPTADQRASVYRRRREMAVTPAVSPTTSTAVSAVVVVPLPSWP